MTLPTGWTWATLGDVARWGSGGTPKSGVSRYYGGDIPWVVSGDLNDEPIRASTSTITTEGLNSSSAKWVPEGSVLIAMYGATIGKLAITERPLTTNQAVAFATPNENLIDKKFLFWYLRAQREDLRKTGKGGAQPNISQAILKAWPIPIPPLAEQNQIVENLEGQLSRLDAASSLVASCANRFKALLPRVMQAELRQTGAPMVQLSELADVRLGRQRSPKNHTGDQMRPYLRAANVSWQGLALDDVNKMNFTDKEAEIYRLHAGDIILSEASGSPGEVGKPAIWNNEIEDCCFQNTLIRVRPREGVNPQFLLHFLRSEALSGEFRKGVRGVGIHHLGSAKLAAWKVPLPSRAEQIRIVERLDAKVSNLESVRAFLSGPNGSLSRARVLRQAILNRAFTGNIVPQNPADEPASVLLDSIRAERESKVGKAKHISRRPRKAEATTDIPPAPATAVQQELPL
ncbi:restriction endonuclease subunit S [Kibdelosporangium phytohabitans]|uniref:restriction endonuclease subunit S n=1 Tax=Kibdelosporangium phytohabitans TaxID=860235 RepID=UPI000A9A3E3F|nr:restriction endonuclease subunit S [Kibdelosporangium phytohabitans]